MNERISGLRKFRVIVLGAALAALATGVVQAAIPAADGTISACYDKQSGQVRIVDSESTSPKPCGPKEISISFCSTPLSTRGPACGTAARFTPR